MYNYSFKKMPRYFDKMNMSASLLDPVLHTPQYVVVRSPFLFTVGEPV
jgi:hypothetical protein